MLFSEDLTVLDSLSRGDDALLLFESLDSTVELVCVDGWSFPPDNGAGGEGQSLLLPGGGDVVDTTGPKGG